MPRRGPNKRDQSVPGPDSFLAADGRRNSIDVSELTDKVRIFKLFLLSLLLGFDLLLDSDRQRIDF